MTLQQLTYFLTTAEHRSFSAAAAALHMAQPSLSEQVRRLEAELGVELFARGGRRLQLTEAGKILRPHAERAVAAAADAADAVREIRTLSGGTITFGTFGSPPGHLIADLVQDFCAVAPDVRVRIIGRNSSEVAASVRDGGLEAGLIVLPIDDTGLDVRPIARVELLYLSKDPSRTSAPMTIERFAEAPLILYDARFGASDPTRRQLVERAQEAGVKIEPRFEVEFMEAAFELASRGLGDTVGTQAIVGKGWTRRLEMCSFDPPVYDTFAFVTRRGAHLSPAAREFMRLAEGRIQQLVRRATGA